MNDFGINTKPLSFSNPSMASNTSSFEARSNLFSSEALKLQKGQVSEAKANLRKKIDNYHPIRTALISLFKAIKALNPIMEIEKFKPKSSAPQNLKELFCQTIQEATYKLTLATRSLQKDIETELAELKIT